MVENRAPWWSMDYQQKTWSETKLKDTIVQTYISEPFLFIFNNRLKQIVLRVLPFSMLQNEAQQTKVENLNFSCD